MGHGLLYSNLRQGAEEKYEHDLAGGLLATTVGNFGVDRSEADVTASEKLHPLYRYTHRPLNSARLGSEEKFPFLIPTGGP